jgi:predicted unusual protein kinase regulating ubiquinone biosynthesis (AarF/ABC1/UbiB family)
MLLLVCTRRPFTAHECLCLLLLPPRSRSRRGSGPIVAHYRWVEAKHSWLSVSDDAARAEWAALDHRYAVPTVKKLGELQGMYVKYGQTLAGLTNTFSLAWINEFRKLEDQVCVQSLTNLAFCPV